MQDLQPASQEIWEKKYQLKDEEGRPLDKIPSETLRRIAKSLAILEQVPEKWEEKFFWALENGATPAGRIISNAGAEHLKPATSTINCTVSGTIKDSMQDILGKLLEAGMTLKSGAGIGYDFSTLRPRGAFVKGPGASTSGPLSFMEVYDKMCFTVSSAGGRRGAQMGVLDIRHPDIEEFIKAKRTDGAFRQFNLSVLITDDFMQAVQENADWHLIFPVNRNQTIPKEYVLAHWPVGDDYHLHPDGRAVCKIYKTVKARDLWDKIMQSNYDFAEPGFILIDRSNEMNNNWWCEEIRATNPCGEQNLPPYGACLLGSINLTKFVQNAFHQEACFDWDKFSEVVRIFTRMLDNVVEINRLPLEQQREEIQRKRRHGMGFYGLGSAMSLLGIRYGSPESVKFTEEVMKVMVLEGWREGVELAMEKGPAPIMKESFVITEKMLQLHPEIETEFGFSVGESVPGSFLFCRSKYLQSVLPEDLLSDIDLYGCRFTHHTSIAPTGTLALSLGNNVSNGIEPSFSHHYTRNVVESGKKSKKSMDVWSYEMLLWKQIFGDREPPEMVTTDDLTPMDHIRIQAVAQKWVDSSISKTINVPTDISFEDFQQIYLDAYENGLKGCTTFRFNPAAFQGVLVKKEEISNTQYKFTLDNGEVVILKGDEEVEYDGEIHTAANLFDAMKEGYYGKF